MAKKKKRRPGRPRSSKPTIRRWLMENRDKHPDREKLIKACIRTLKVCRPAVLLKLKEVAPGAATADGKKLGFSKVEFMAQQDDLTAARAAIRQGLAALGSDNILSDTDFRRFCNGPSTGWKEAMQGFSENLFRCGGKVWWAAKTTVKQVLRDVRKAKEF